MNSIRESAPKVDWKKCPVLHQGMEPASAARWSDTLPTELHPHPVFVLYTWKEHNKKHWYHWKLQKKRAWGEKQHLCTHFSRNDDFFYMRKTFCCRTSTHCLCTSWCFARPWSHKRGTAPGCGNRQDDENKAHNGSGCLSQKAHTALW